jgi:hypothetical protein
VIIPRDIELLSVSITRRRPPGSAHLFRRRREGANRVPGSAPPSCRGLGPPRCSPAWAAARFLAKTKFGSGRSGAGKARWRIDAGRVDKGVMSRTTARPCGQRGQEPGLVVRFAGFRQHGILW